MLRAPPELGRPKGAADRIALPVAWDDPAAKATVLKLVDELGFDGVEPEVWMSPGGNSPAHQSMPTTSMPRACGGLCPKPKKTVLRNGAPLTVVPVASPRRLE